MHARMLFVLFLICFLISSCDKAEKGSLSTEAERWEIKSADGVVLFYYLQGDFQEEILKELLADAASHELSGGYEQVQIIALYEKDLIRQLSSEEGKKRFYEGVQDLGPPVLSDPGLSTTGGAFYSTGGDEEEWQYLPKDPG